MGLEAFYRRMSSRSWDGHRHGVERHMDGSSQCGTVLLLGVREEDFSLIGISNKSRVGRVGFVEYIHENFIMPFQVHALKDRVCAICKNMGAMC